MGGRESGSGRREERNHMWRSGAEGLVVAA
jgi:hypothetical protein